MRVKIGNYTSWFGPYQLASALCFWAKDEVDEHGLKDKPDWVHDFGEWLAYGSVAPDTDITRISDDRDVTFLYKFLLWIESKKKRKVEVHIDKWDTWNLGETLALITLPMLKQLQDTKHGSPQVEDEDVPAGLGLRSDEAPAKENDWDTDDNIHKRWDWVLAEMIWAFEQIADDDNDDQFHTGEHDIYFEKVEGENYSEMKNGPKDTHVFDKEGYKKHQDRIQRGTILFGKYYRGLWD